MSNAKTLYPIGVQDFEDLRKRNFCYVDKTQYVHDLATRGKYYFLSRPRRFGKSLLLSTFKAYYEGKRDLFKGLAIEQLEQDWVEYPVLHLDLNLGKYQVAGELESVLTNTLDRWSTQFELSATGPTLALRFANFVNDLSRKTNRQVVILIDEYDKPLLNAIGNQELLNDQRATLKTFYGVLKTMDAHIRFAMLTGVTKFGKVSVFSDLNNLDDISMDNRYANICGITEEELHRYFEQGIQELAEKQQMTAEQMSAKLKQEYDGYHFVPGSEGVYNPYSLLNTLNKQQLKDYWFETGTPTFLFELLKQSDYDLRELEHEEQTTDMIEGIYDMNAGPVPVIYQAGYLTIKGYDPEFGFYKLGFPNGEVERGFIKYLLKAVAPAQQRSEFFVGKFIADVRQGRPEEFMRRLQAFFADGNYQVAGDGEKYFQNCMYLVFKVMGFYTQAERATSHGRIDVVVRAPGYTYVIEIKYNGSAQEALAQINSKDYALPYALDGNKLFKIGVNFDGEKRGIAEWQIE